MPDYINDDPNTLASKHCKRPLSIPILQVIEILIILVNPSHLPWFSRVYALLGFFFFGFSCIVLHMPSSSRVQLPLA